MEQLEQTAGLGGAGRKRVEAVVETLATSRCRGENLAEVAHDARNMVTALGLYCDLLEEPGVLSTPFIHYGNELRLVAAASRRLVEKLVALDTQTDTRVDASVVAGAVSSLDCGQAPERLPAEAAGAGRLDRRRWNPMPAPPIDDLAAELRASRNLLAALAGPSIAVIVDSEGGARPVSLTAEDLTRILVNLVKNAAEAMPSGGRITIGLHEFHAGAEAAPWLVLTVEDDGPGIPRKGLDRVFESGYTTHADRWGGDWPTAHRGLGLSITRSIVEAAGGRIHAVNSAQAGARLEIELPVRMR